MIADFVIIIYFSYQNTNIKYVTYAYEDSIMKPTKYSLKEWEKNGRTEIEQKE
jgi:hypothetical protein